MPSSFVIGVLIDMHSSVWYGTISTRCDPARLELSHESIVARPSLNPSKPCMIATGGSPNRCIERHSSIAHTYHVCRALCTCKHQVMRGRDTLSNPPSQRRNVKDSVVPAHILGYVYDGMVGVHR